MCVLAHQALRAAYFKYALFLATNVATEKDGDGVQVPNVLQNKKQRDYLNDNLFVWRAARDLNPRPTGS